MIFIERNDSNQISNLIEYQTGESKLIENSVLSENSDIGNEGKNDSIYFKTSDNHLSEYDVQKIEDRNTNEFESENDAFNYFDNENEDRINYLWKREKKNNQESQIIDRSSKMLISQFNKYYEHAIKSSIYF